MSDADKSLLTLAQLHEWEARAGELAEAIRGYEHELAHLARKINAAKLFMTDDDRDTPVRR